MDKKKKTVERLATELAVLAPMGAEFGPREGESREAWKARHKAAFLAKQAFQKAEAIRLQAEIDARKVKR